MTPLTIDGCFGWLHLPKCQPRTAVLVLCPGLKADEITGYSSLRILAEALAEQGYPVLRLHYIGTGDSCDPYDEIEYWAAWQGNIDHSIDWLRQHCCAEHVVLCGLRFGGMLASVVAARRLDVNGLILLAPVLRGRSYIRQMQSDGFVTAGARLSPNSIELISAADLRTVMPASDCKVVVFTQSASSARVVECIETWRAGGTEATVTELSSLEAMLRPTFANHKTPVTTEPIVAWMQKTFPARSTRSQDLCLPPIQMKSHLWAETPLFFGADRHLFGILCRPCHASTGAAVIIGNSSADPHCAGNTVALARQLAAKGVPSLRMDFAGIGDSPSATGIGSHVFEIDRTDDISAAINELQCLGYKKFATEGLCSGAYHAYHAAIADPRIDYALMINLPFFDWVPGFPVEDLVFHARKPSQLLCEMQKKVFWLNQWNKIAQVDLHLIRNRFVWLERKLRHVPGSGRARKPVQHASRQLKMLFLVSEGDVSREILRREFGSRGVASGVTIELVDGLDHAMQNGSMCTVVAERMSSFLSADHPVPMLGTQDASANSHATPVLAERMA